MDGYRTSRSESISSATSSAAPYVDSPRPDQHASAGVSSGAFPAKDDPEGMSEEVRVAIAALGIMKRGGSTTGTASSSTSSLPPIDGAAGRPDASRSASTASNASYQWSQSGVTADSTAASSPVPPGSSAATESDLGDFDEAARGGQASAEGADPRFIERVSQLPLVNGGLEWYGHAKASSRLVKYGAGLVESSFSAVSRPIANQLGPLDDFACRQLDRLGGAQSSPGEGGSAARDQPQDYVGGSRDPSGTRPLVYGEEGYWEQREREREAYEAKEAQEAQAQRPQGNEERAVAVAGRSRWQTVLVEAGGLGAAVSEESLKSLRYCLQWLLYATAHLDHQINTLRDFIISLQRHTSSSSQSDALVTASATAHLSRIKHDVVETIRKVVEVVSKYAGVALPEQAKRYVRQSILGLPVKWASAIEGGRDGRGSSVGAASDVSTPRAERMEDPYASAQASTSGAVDGEQQRSAVLAKTEDAADRVLTFAVESLDMLKSVTSIFGESVQKAEDWIERLRIVGLDRQRQRQASGSMPPPDDDYLATGTKRRRAIARDSDDGTASGVEVGAGADGEEGLLRRKKGARSEAVQA